MAFLSIGHMCENLLVKSKKLQTTNRINIKKTDSTYFLVKSIAMGGSKYANNESFSPVDGDNHGLFSYN